MDGGRTHEAEGENTQGINWETPMQPTDTTLMLQRLLLELRLFTDLARVTAGV